MAHSASVVIGTRAFCSVSGVLPPSLVVPQPTICSLTPGDQSAPSLEPATFVGACVAGCASCRSVMSLPEVAR